MTITRKQYMADSENLHHDYYKQFVNPYVLERVVQYIGADRLRKSTDPHLNDIPLREWDRLEPWLKSVCAVARLGDTWSLGTAVCIAKAAARMYLRGEKAEFNT